HRPSAATARSLPSSWAVSLTLKFADLNLATLSAPPIALTALSMTALASVESSARDQPARDRPSTSEPIHTARMVDLPKRGTGKGDRGAVELRLRLYPRPVSRAKENKSATQI